MKKIFLVLLLTTVIGCIHYSTPSRPKAENIINAPIDLVWEKTLEVLSIEKISLKMASKYNYFIAGRKDLTLWSWDEDIIIQLIQKGKKQTIMQFIQRTDWEHEGRMTKNLFNRVKTIAERSNH